METPEIFFTDKNLENFVNELDISSEQKDKVKERIPNMNFEERKELLMAMVKVYFLGLEEKKALDRVDKFWQA
ncbi:MAG: hypothetical protein GF370_04010 [Candidatus Nealsonbacteria bacterium]|nr:hypothetical protein [Candidatus Nealsonbacteria bacterium]